MVIAAGGVLATLIGLLCYLYSFADPLQRLSYDLPFLWRGTIDTPEVVLVYLDDQSAKEFGQPFADKWSRNWHSKLLNRMTDETARLVFFDIVFVETTNKRN